MLSLPNTDNVTVIRHSEKEIYILVLKEPIPHNQLLDVFKEIKEALPENSKFVCIPHQCILSQCTTEQLISARNMINDYLVENCGVKESPMRDMTPEEKEEYNRILDKYYKPTGINIFNLVDTEE